MFGLKPKTENGKTFKNALVLSISSSLILPFLIFFVITKLGVYKLDFKDVLFVIAALDFIFIVVDSNGKGQIIIGRSLINLKSPYTGGYLLGSIISLLIAFGIAKMFGLWN